MSLGKEITHNKGTKITRYFLFFVIGILSIELSLTGVDSSSQMNLL